jgi:hypothetical protein
MGLSEAKRKERSARSVEQRSEQRGQHAAKRKKANLVSSLSYSGFSWPFGAGIGTERICIREWEYAREWWRKPAFLGLGGLYCGKIGGVEGGNWMAPVPS